MKFKALTNFRSSEFDGTQYVEGGVYTIRPGNSKLAGMAQKWLEAQRFIPKVDFTVLGMSFKAGQESYYLQDDALKDLIDLKVQNGEVDLSSVGLITFGVVTGGGEISGGAVKQINGGQI